MRRTMVFATVIGTCAAVLGVARLAFADFPELLRRVPGDANVIVVMDVQRILDSPLGKSEGWREKRAADYAARPLTFPPSVTKLVRAAHFDFDLNESKSQVALLEGTRVPPLETIAKKESGSMDTIANTSAVFSPRGWYAIKVGSSGLGVMFPANRQYLSRWIKEPAGRASTYLTKAAAEVTASGPQLLIALDLDDVVKPQQLEARLKDAESLEKATNIGEIAKTVASIQGVRLAVTIKEKAAGSITVDFGRDAAALKDVAKPLLIEAVKNRGLYIDDLESWTASVNGKSVKLSGDLSRSGLMRLSSVMELPDPPLDDSGRDVEKVDAGDPKLYATQNYFKQLQTLLDDLLAMKDKATNFGHMAQYVDQYAKRIDRLPTLNVDEDMQKYSMKLVELLRDAAGGFRGVGIRTGGRQAQTYGYGGYDYYGNRTGYNYDVDNQRRAIKAEEVAAGATAGRQIREQIADETTKVRRLMTDRYKVNF